MAKVRLIRDMPVDTRAGLPACARAALPGGSLVDLAITCDTARQHGAGHAMEPERGISPLIPCAAADMALGGIPALAFGFLHRRVGRSNAVSLALLLALAVLVALSATARSALHCALHVEMTLVTLISAALALRTGPGIAFGLPARRRLHA